MTPESTCDCGILYVDLTFDNNKRKGPLLSAPLISFYLHTKETDTAAD